jgi:hypothetical protein
MHLAAIRKLISFTRYCSKSLPSHLSGAAGCPLVGATRTSARRFRGAARRPRAHRAAAPSAWSHINSKRSDAISTPVREAEIVAENPAGSTGEPEQPEAATACPPGLSGIVSTPVAPEADTGDYVDGPIHVTNEDGFQPLR